MPEINNTEPQIKPILVPAAGTSTIPASDEGITRGASKDDIQRIEKWMFAVVIFVVVSFLGTFFLLLWDFIKEKDLYLKYSDFYQQYSDQNSELKAIVNDQRMVINNLRNELEILRVRNPYLK